MTGNVANVFNIRGYVAKCDNCSSRPTLYLLSAKRSLFDDEDEGLIRQKGQRVDQAQVDESPESGIFVGFVPALKLQEVSGKTSGRRDANPLAGGLDDGRLRLQDAARHRLHLDLGPMSIFNPKS